MLWTRLRHTASQMEINLSRSYSELILLPSFKERFDYLQLKGNVCDATFGGHRYLNQMLYRDPEWKSVRRGIIIRDNGCDLAHPDYELIFQSAFVHHMNPITIEDILQRDPKVFDPENLITVSFNTHQAIHYGSEDLLPKDPVERKPFDTCPWKE